MIGQAQVFELYISSFYNLDYKSTKTFRFLAVSQLLFLIHFVVPDSSLDASQHYTFSGLSTGTDHLRTLFELVLYTDKLAMLGILRHKGHVCLQHALLEFWELVRNIAFSLFFFVCESLCKPRLCKQKRTE